jgi:hypothetical protein
MHPVFRDEHYAFPAHDYKRYPFLGSNPDGRVFADTLEPNLKKLRVSCGQTI